MKTEYYIHKQTLIDVSESFDEMYKFIEKEWECQKFQVSIEETSHKGIYEIKLSNKLGEYFSNGGFIYSEEELIDAISNETNREFIGEYCISTLMGTNIRYDEFGRPLNCDCNYKDSKVRIGNTRFALTRKGWYAYIWKPEWVEKASYTWLMSTMLHKEELMICKVDLRPDYVKEYEENNRIHTR